MIEETMLTTTDNPYDPFTQYDDWYGFDESKGYHTCAYLARVARTSNELSEADYNAAIDEAIDDILKHDVEGIYMRVSKKGTTHGASADPIS